MAQASAPAGNATAADAGVAFIEYSEYNGYTIIVPEQFSDEDSNQFMKLQVQAIDAGAISEVERDTIVNTAAWTTEGQPCVHINFCPVLRDDFDYSAFLPLSLVEKCGRIVAGVCVTSLGQCRQLYQRIKFLPSSVDDGLELLLKRLWLRRNTNLVHNDGQDTSDRSSSTTSTICSPSTLKTITEVREEGLGAIMRHRRQNDSEWDGYAAKASEPKRARTAQTHKPSSGSASIQPTFSSDSIMPDRKDIIHAPTTEIGNLLPLPLTTTKAKMMAYLELDDQTHGLLLAEAHKVRDSTCQTLNNPSWKDLLVKVKHEATSEMVNKASAKTKKFYEKGKWWNNGNEENWVACWYLYQCFRYKNNRQTKLNKARAAATQDSGRGDHQPLIEEIQGGGHFSDMESAKLHLTGQPESQRLGGACDRSDGMRPKCGTRFHCQRCRESYLECIRWEEKLKWQGMQSSFRSTSTSSAVPTTVDFDIRAKSSTDAQCGNSVFSDVQKDWIDPVSLSFWNGVLERAYLSKYYSQAIR